ncbi:MAG: hypothetical protein ABUS54_02815 [Actinomycetota bacterium]
MHALPPRAALVPNAIVFRDRRHGALGGGLTGGTGTVQVTADGGRTWRVVLRTPTPVTAISYAGKGLRIVLADNSIRASTDGASGWHAAPPIDLPRSPCPPSLFQSHWAGNWVLCTGQSSTGAGGKAVYRYADGRWRRLAYTPFPPPGRSTGGISLMGYALGITMAPDGFGLIWESRGTLYLTRDGGSHWLGLPKVAVPEVDFGEAATALPQGTAFAVLARGNVHRRLLETTDAGRTWRVVHRWR